MTDEQIRETLARAEATEKVCSMVGVPCPDDGPDVVTDLCALARRRATAAAT